MRFKIGQLRQSGPRWHALRCALTPPSAALRLPPVERPALEESAARGRAKLDTLLRLAEGRVSLLAQTHDYPDPDTIASALGLGWLLGELAGLETTIGYGGVIARAENKTMIKQLGIKMRRTTRADFKKYDLVALLDTQPEVGNHCLPAERPPDVVFDHHFPRDLEGPEPPLFDVGGDYGATSTKIVELIIAAGVQPPKEVATALFYGIKTDTQNLARDASEADVTAYLYLVGKVDNRILAEIENPQVPLDYFRVFNKAITRSKIYGRMIVSDLGEVYTPDLCAEVADRLLQIEGVKHALAVGWHEESLFLSLRTRSRAKNAGKILHGIVCGAELGTAGGHGPMAGARVPVDGKSQRTRMDIRRQVVNGVVQAFGEDYRHFSRLLSKKEASSNAIEPPPPKEKSEGPRRRAKVEDKRTNTLKGEDRKGEERRGSTRTDTKPAEPKGNGRGRCSLEDGPPTPPAALPGGGHAATA